MSALNAQLAEVEAEAAGADLDADSSERARVAEELRRVENASSALSGRLEGLSTVRWRLGSRAVACGWQCRCCDMAPRPKLLIAPWCYHSKTSPAFGVAPTISQATYCQS